mgnify:CR=1 FL=1|tara:strand:+ start:274 stop:1545 length:1272 start_codon:yes stop_codon:yes gene_type:complete
MAPVTLSNPGVVLAVALNVGALIMMRQLCGHTQARPRGTGGRAATAGGAREEEAGTHSGVAVTPAAPPLTPSMPLRPGAAAGWKRALVLVPSVLNDRAGRDLVRSTWMRDVEPGTPAAAELGMEVEVKFVVGNSIAARVEDRHPFASTESCRNATLYSFRILEELEAHKDVLMLSVLDNSLTLKSMAMFEWAFHNRPGVDYVLKVDMDTYVHWPRFRDYLRTAMVRPGANGSVVVGRRHTNTGLFAPRYTLKVGGELYGCSMAHLAAILHVARASSTLTLQGLLGSAMHQLKREGAKWRHVYTKRNLPPENWAALVNFVHEDIAMSILLHTVQARWTVLSDKQLNLYWAHGKKLKDPHEYLKCHQTGKCIGDGGKRAQLRFKPRRPHDAPVLRSNGAKRPGQSTPGAEATRATGAPGGSSRTT